VGGRGDPLWASPISPSGRGRPVSELAARALSKRDWKFLLVLPLSEGEMGEAQRGSPLPPTYRFERPSSTMGEIKGLNPPSPLLKERRKYLFPPKKYINPSLIYLFLSLIYVFLRKNYLFLRKN